MSTKRKLSPAPVVESVVAPVAKVFDLHDLPEILEVPAPIGHNRSDAPAIPVFTDSEASAAIQELKHLKATVKLETQALRRKVQIAELRLLVPAMEQAYTHRNSNFLVKLVKGAGLSGPIKRAILATITNLVKVADGKMVFDPLKTPETHVSAKTGALLPVWDEARWAFLKSVYANEVSKGLDPITDEWKDTFPSPEKTTSELLESFSSQVSGAKKKGLTIQQMMAILQAKLDEGNIAF